ncbi:hypothetical protein K2173_006354 [Erythroxylum novogranatense]|uniref:Uncharacterized protein n=1 Tax=Erythroxylum novogranatense TaxID=1862640 RepID=A0AAV8U680_9ROSI|nr:hypothetical protein K2173_006354 [Erythroxylum novogranatense]
MADSQRNNLANRDIEQAIIALKKGSHLLKYGRRGKPKFCPFQLSSDESMLTWYSGKEEKHLLLSQVSKIIPGQRTAIFQRYPRPEKEYQSFSLIYGDRSLDLICKEKDEAEVWFVGLKALITGGNYSNRWRIDSRSDSLSSESPRSQIRKTSPAKTQFHSEHGNGEGTQLPSDSSAQNRLGKAFAEIISHTATAKYPSQSELAGSPISLLTAACLDNSSNRNSTSDAARVSLSSAVSSSSQGSGHEDFDALGDVFIWGEGIGDGILGGGVHRTRDSAGSQFDAFLPKALESTVVLDVQNIACGSRHAVLVTRQGQIYSWGEESGGRLGHGFELDVLHPKVINYLNGLNIEFVACGEYHTCALTPSGDLFTWGDGTHTCGLLGHGTETSHWIPRKLGGFMDGIRVTYVSCGPWHTATVTSVGQLFTFGDGTFGALGHGDRSSSIIPREVETLRGLRTTRVACGVWHTAAVVEMTSDSPTHETSDSSSSGQLFTWGDGDEFRLGQGDKEPRLVPECVTVLLDENICQVACGQNLTVALTAAGRVYTMGSTSYGQLGNPAANGKVPTPVGGCIQKSFVEEVSCGAYHVAILTSKTEVYTWGKGKNGQLGHGDNDDRNRPTLVKFFKDKQVKTVVCGSNFTSVICLHKLVSSADQSVCSGCRNPFGFRRKRHNCYNCGLVFCNVCSSRKSLKASLAPNMYKPYRVCDECFNKLKKAAESNVAIRLPKNRNGNVQNRNNELVDREIPNPIFQTHNSRLSSARATSQSETWQLRRDKGQEVYNNRVFPSSNVNFQVGSFQPSKLPTLFEEATKKLTPSSPPRLKMANGSRSFSERKSTALSHEKTMNYAEYINDNSSDEVLCLKAQVEELTIKTQNLEAELEKKSRQLKEVTAIAADEAEKCKSAREVIKLMTAQIKQMAERLPEEQTASQSTSSIANQDLSLQNLSSSGFHSTSELSHDIETNGNSIDTHMLSYGVKSQHERPQRVIQVEPGVYITLSSLPGGGNELKRIRFSRKKFTEQEAEKWWAENGVKVCERHAVQSQE